MIIGVPKEIKVGEYRVAMLPAGVRLLAGDGHKVIVEAGAGTGSGIHDAAYASAGAEIVSSAAELFRRATMIIKVKEPQSQEFTLLQPEQIIFCYFHFAASRQLVEGCLATGITALAYETLSDENGSLPLLTPMSEVAGKIAVQAGIRYLEKPIGGRGVLLGGVPGVEPAKVLILGGGTVGSNAARVAAGLGAQVIIMDNNLDRLRFLSQVMPANVMTLYADPHNIEEQAVNADLIVGAVLIPGARPPVLIKRELLRKMKQDGAVIVDVCIDQGGCFETSRPTTHQDPIFLEEGVIHYCVANMPSAVCRTSSYALCNATLPYCREIARLGLDAFTGLSRGRLAALNIRNGKIANPVVAGVFPDLPQN